MTGFRGIAFGLATCGLLFLSGCMSATRYEAVTEALKGSPALRRDEIARCTSNNRSTAAQKELMGKLMNLPPRSDVVRVACERIVSGMVSGKLTYSDYQKVSMRQLTPQLVRVLQAR
jgi:hypothetical protein